MDIYKPAEDSYLLKKNIINYVLARHPKKVLDMGTGSGIIALTFVDLGIPKVFASDINKKALDKLKKTEKRINTIYSNLFDNIDEKFDLISFNTPYLPVDNIKENNDPIWSGGKEFIENFLQLSKSYLTKNGCVLFTYSSKSPINIKHEIIDEIKFEDGEIVYVGKFILN